MGTEEQGFAEPDGPLTGTRPRVTVNGEPVADTSGNTLVRREDIPGAHAACDAEIARLRVLVAEMHTLTGSLSGVTGKPSDAPGTPGTSGPSDDTREHATSRQRGAQDDAGGNAAHPLAAFGVMVTEDGETHLVCPEAYTPMGCLWGHTIDPDPQDRDHITLGDLMAAAKAHTGPAADEKHREQVRYMEQVEACEACNGEEERS